MKGETERRGIQEKKIEKMREVTEGREEEREKKKTQ